MIIPRRRVLQLAAASATVPALVRGASALDYPTRPVRLLVGFAAGGPLDVGARLIAQWLSQRLGQSFIVENRPGASGNIAAEYVVRAAPDGYTLLECASPNAWNMTLYDNLDFDFVRDITPVASVSRNGGVMEVALAVPATTVPEFIAYAKANPGKVYMGSGGPGSGPGLWGELFKVMAGVDLVTVTYPGTAPALIDLMSGRIQVMFDVGITAIGPIKGRKVRALAVTTPQRMAMFPDLPAIAEFLPGYVGTGWQGIAAPKGTPRQIIELLNKEVNAALVDPAFKARLADLGADPFANSPAGFGAFIADFAQKWAKVIRTAGLKAQ